jgi:hypothetical protein
VEPDSIALAKRYYYVIETGYDGVKQTLPPGDEEDEARRVGMEVIVNGNVPDPNEGTCLAGSPFGDLCGKGAGCTAAKGTWGAFIPPRGLKLEFRGGEVKWQGGGSTTCQWEELVPKGQTPSGAFCGSDCWVRWGLTCPRYNWLHNGSGCVGAEYQFWAPWRGNFFWRLVFPGYPRLISSSSRES